LLDEPTANIDISTKTEILEIIKTINIEQKVSFLICTHFLEEIEILNASYIILKDGNFVFDSKNQPELSITNIKEIYLQNTR
jgi:ABC-2 type transport system ATP-binding protein